MGASMKRSLKNMSRLNGDPTKMQSLIILSLICTSLICVTVVVFISLNKTSLPDRRNKDKKCTKTITRDEKIRDVQILFHAGIICMCLINFNPSQPIPSITKERIVLYYSIRVQLFLFLDQKFLMDLLHGPNIYKDTKPSMSVFRKN